MSDPIVSIVIPVYNTGTYLRKALESCIRQTFHNLEIIVVNDGSTDNSLAIAEEYKKEIPDLHVITTENHGLSAARNLGLSLAKGEYIYFLDSDDWIDEDTIEQCYGQACKDNLDIVMFDSKIYLEEGLDAYKDNSYDRAGIVDESKIYRGKDFIEEYQDKKGVFVQAWLMLIRRKFIENHRIVFLHGAYYEDVKFHFDAMIYAERIKYIGKAFHNRLYRENSIMTTSLTSRKALSVYEICLGMLERVKEIEEDQSFWLQYCEFRIKSLFRTIFCQIRKNDMANIEVAQRDIILLQESCINVYCRLLSDISPKMSSLKRMDAIIREIVLPFGWASDSMIASVKHTIESIVRQKLIRLPLQDKERCIGIYGCGKHAEVLMDLYEQYIGDMQARILFIDSKIETGSECFHGRKIINIQDIEKAGIEEVIIFSYLHEKELADNIRERYGNTFPVHTIYTDDPLPVDTLIGKNLHSMLRLKMTGQYRRIVLINTPEHTNIGDHLIAVAEKRFFANYFPQYELYEITNKRYDESRREMQFQISLDDVIIITGGGFFGSLWPYSGGNVNKIFQDFPDNRIIVFPQSIYFEDTEDGTLAEKEICRLLNKFSNVSLICRESLSYERAKSMFDEGPQLYCLPDIALWLNYSGPETEREGISIYLRNDLESTLHYDVKRNIKLHFINGSFAVDESSMHWKNAITLAKREEIILNKLAEIKSRRLVITDMLHCMISCIITGTPCIAIDNINGKLGGIHEWVSHLKYVVFLNDIETIFQRTAEEWVMTLQPERYESNLDKQWGRLAEIVRKAVE